MENNTFKSDYARFWIDEHEIFCCTYFPNIRITLDISREEIQKCQQLRNGQRSLSLVDITGVVSVEREARINYASDAAEKVYTAVGLIVNSMISRTIGIFFLGINKPAFPVKLFTNESDGKKWLLGLKE